MRTERHAKIKFVKKTVATRAKPDGGRYKQTFKVGQVEIVPIASANFRIEQGQAKFIEFVDVQVKDEPKVKPFDRTKEIINVEDVEGRNSELVEARPAIEVLPEILAAINSLDLKAARRALAGLTLQSFSDFVDDHDIIDDSKLVISAAIEEYAETEDFSTINIGDLKDSIENALAAVS